MYMDFKPWDRDISHLHPHRVEFLAVISSIANTWMIYFSDNYDIYKSDVLSNCLPEYILTDA